MPDKRLKPLSLAPLTLDDALRGAMQVAPPDESKPKRRKRKARKKRARKS